MKNIILHHTSASNRNYGKDPHMFHTNIKPKKKAPIDFLILQVNYEKHPLLNKHLLHSKINTLCHDQAFNNYTDSQNSWACKGPLEINIHPIFVLPGSINQEL